MAYSKHLRYLSCGVIAACASAVIYRRLWPRAADTCQPSFADASNITENQHGSKNAAQNSVAHCNASPDSPNNIEQDLRRLTSLYDGSGRLKAYIMQKATAAAKAGRSSIGIRLAGPIDLDSGKPWASDADVEAVIQELSGPPEYISVVRFPEGLHVSWAHVKPLDVVGRMSSHSM